MYFIKDNPFPLPSIMYVLTYIMITDKDESNKRSDRYFRKRMAPYVFVLKE